MCGLSDVQPIEEGDEAQTFQWDCQVIVDAIKYLGSNRLQYRSHRKIVNLSKEEDSIVGNKT